MDCFLHQHVTIPTRYRLGSVPSLLDLVITNEEGMVSCIDYMPGLSMSDHLILSFTVICYTAPKTMQLKCKPALHKADYGLLRREAKKVNWDSILNLNFQEAYSFIVNKISGLVDQHVPMVNPAKTKNLYMNREALRLRKKKQRLWTTFTKSGAPEDFSKFSVC